MSERPELNKKLDAAMAFDFKKEYKEFYMPKNKPEIVNVPKANYIAVRISVIRLPDFVTK